MQRVRRSWPRRWEDRRKRAKYKENEEDDAQDEVTEINGFITAESMLEDQHFLLL